VAVPTPSGGTCDLSGIEATLAEIQATLAEIKAKTDNLPADPASQASMNRLLGLALENHVEDDIVRDAAGNKLSSVLYLYDSAANATAHNKSTGLLAKYNVTAAYSGGKMATFRVVKV